MAKFSFAGVLAGGKAAPASKADEGSDDGGEFKPCPDCDNTDHCAAAGSCRDKSKASKTEGARSMTDTAVTAAAQPNATPAPATASADDIAALREQLAAEADTTAKKPAQTAAITADQLRADASEIIDLCQIAGKPGAAADFIRKGASPAAVRQALLSARADTYEASAVTPLNTSAGVPGEHPIVAAAKAEAARVATARR